MTNLFVCRVARVLGSAAVLWIVPASATDFAVTACASDGTEVRSATAGKKALMGERYSSVVPPLHGDRIAKFQRHRHARYVDRNYYDTWYRRQFVLMLGVAY
jgi:hypothetical protein